MVNLQGQHIKGHLDLSHTPRTVEKLLMERNTFTEIRGLDQLAGKKLRSLDIRVNPLNIDLQPLNRSSPRSIGNPLKCIHVNAYQVALHLLGRRCYEEPRGPEMRTISAKDIKRHEVHKALKEWIKSSTLSSMMLGRKTFLYP